MSGIEGRWMSRVLTEEEKDWVRAVLEARAHQLGQITADNISLLTTYRSLARVVRMIDDTKLMAADVAWSWVAERQEAACELVSPTLRRMSSGTGAAPIPRWEWYARNISGWDREQGATVTDAVRMRLLDMVLVHLIRAEEGTGWQEWAEEGRALWLSKGTVRKAWMTVKSAFSGAKGYESYLSMITVLMIEGEVEGGVGLDPTEGSWWGEAVEMSANLPLSVWGPRPTLDVTPNVTRVHEVVDLVSSDEETVARQVIEVVSSGEEGAERRKERQRGRLVVREEEESLCQSEVEWMGRYNVVVDWMAGSQSLRKAVSRERRLLYVPLDWQEWVYSRAMRGWVQNVVIDLCSATPQVVWATVLEVVRGMVGHIHSQQVQIVLLAMSPDCTTFSKADSSNVAEGHNYRLHDRNNPHRPPKDNHSAKGKKAHEADEMVKTAIRLVRHLWSEGHQDMPIYMENPVGSLCRQKYMLDWEDSLEVERVSVDYCAYDHWYHKPTHIWTNMKRWKPKGSTGTGRCRARCKHGYRGSKGRWVHRYKIAQGSNQAKGGKGRKAYKNMMPYKLHRELLRVAKLQAK